MEKKLDFDTVIGVVGAIVGLLGIGYALGTRSKANKLCEKLDTTIEDVSNNVPINVPEEVINQAVERAAERKAYQAVENATDDVIRSLRKEIRDEVCAEVDKHRSAISEKVTDQIAAEVAMIDYESLKAEVIEKAKDQVAEKFDDKLDGVLSSFNDNLANVGKIYQSIASKFNSSGVNNGLQFRLD